MIENIQSPQFILLLLGELVVTTFKDNQVGKAVYEDFLPKALKVGAFKTVPEPLVAGKGLESVQGAVDLLQKGLSATKVVVLL